MKKAMVLMMGLFLVCGLFAQNKTTVGINFGTMTDDSFSFNPFFWTAGAEIDLPFGRALMFSPEVTLVGYKFAFKEFLLFPGAVLNFTTSSFFIGGGITKGFYIGSGDTTEITDVALKLNAGLLTDSIKLTAYIITPFNGIFEAMIVGATLGFRL